VFHHEVHHLVDAEVAGVDPNGVFSRLEGRQGASAILFVAAPQIALHLL
jgi:hypothetical protein